MVSSFLILLPYGLLAVPNRMDVVCLPKTQGDWKIMVFCEMTLNKTVEKKLVREDLPSVVCSRTPRKHTITIDGHMMTECVNLHLYPD